MNIAICEDLEKDKQVLLELTKEYFHNKRHDLRLDSFISGEDLIGEIKGGTVFNIVFLDIYMHGMTGMETAKILRELDAGIHIIFTTVSSSFALESYEVQAGGYLVKPIDKDRYAKTMDKIISDFEETKKCLIIRNRGNVIRMIYSEILYIESEGKHIIIHNKDGKKETVYAKLNDIEAKIDSKKFLRCHQSYLVNMEHIESAWDNFMLNNRQIVPIKVRDRKNIRDEYFKYLLSVGNVSVDDFSK